MNSKFKIGDKVIAIHQDSNLYIGDIGIITKINFRIGNGLCVNINNRTDFPYYESYFKLVESSEPVVTKKEETGWGF